ncbi:hypothetical protein [Mycolicibacterium porcinum]|uniref:hypothetical protein n=1 Tax=Mycolicibacterium porcinum TaxID=39693 RepID=UPI0034CD6F85
MASPRSTCAANGGSKPAVSPCGVVEEILAPPIGFTRGGSAGIGRGIGIGTGGGTAGSAAATAPKPDNTPALMAAMGADKTITAAADRLAVRILNAVPRIMVYRSFGSP